MQCSCLVDPSIDDEGEVLVEKHISYHRNCRCCECNRIIEAGDQFLFEQVQWENDIGIFRTCKDCESLRNNLCCSWTYENVLDDIDVLAPLVDEVLGAGRKNVDPSGWEHRRNRGWRTDGKNDP